MNLYLLFTEPDDFSAVSSALMFDSEANRMCVLIPLISDNILEPIEMFEAVLTSDDPDVTLAPEVANISILDTNGMHVYILCIVNSDCVVILYWFISFAQW